MKINRGFADFIRALAIIGVAVIATIGLVGCPDNQSGSEPTAQKNSHSTVDIRDVQGTFVPIPLTMATPSSGKQILSFTVPGSVRPDLTTLQITYNAVSKVDDITGQPIQTATPTPTASPIATAVATATALPRTTPTPTVRPTPTPTPTVRPTATPTPTVRPTPTPTPTIRPTPTATPGTLLQGFSLGFIGLSQTTTIATPSPTATPSTDGFLVTLTATIPAGLSSGTVVIVTINCDVPTTPVTRFKAVGVTKIP